MIFYLSSNSERTVIYIHQIDLLLPGFCTIFGPFSYIAKFEVFKCEIAFFSTGVYVQEFFHDFFRPLLSKNSEMLGSSSFELLI